MFIVLALLIMLLPPVRAGAEDLAELTGVSPSQGEFVNAGETRLELQLFNSAGERVAWFELPPAYLGSDWELGQPPGRYSTSSSRVYRDRHGTVTKYRVYRKLFVLPPGRYEIAWRAKIDGLLVKKESQWYKRSLIVGDRVYNYGSDWEPRYLGWQVRLWHENLPPDTFQPRASVNLSTANMSCILALIGLVVVIVGALQ